jgi:hypothetical protein
MTLYEIDVTASIPQHVEFRKGIEYIIHLYKSCLGSVKTQEIKKVIISLEDKSNLEADFPPINRDLFPLLALGIAGITIPFDFEAYWKITHTSWWRKDIAVSRQKMVLDAIQQGLLKFADLEEIPVEPFEEAYRKVLERDIENTDYLYTPKSSPNRKTKANIEYRFTPYRLKFSVALYDAKGNQITTTHLDSFLPYLGYLRKTYWRLEWLDNETLQFSSRDGKRFWRVDVKKALEEAAKRKAEHEDAERHRQQHIDSNNQS